MEEALSQLKSRHQALITTTTKLEGELSKHKAAASSAELRLRETRAEAKEVNDVSIDSLLC